MSVKERLLAKLDTEMNVDFGYGKINGSFRFADGTRMIGDFSKEWDNTRDVHTYYDNDLSEYRCFKQDTSVLLFDDFKNIERI